VSTKPKPDWFPDCPYPEKIFTMTEAEYEALPDSQKVTDRVAGFLGRTFWKIQEEVFWDAIQQHLDDIEIERIMKEEP